MRISIIKNLRVKRMKKQIIFEAKEMPKGGLIKYGYSSKVSLKARRFALRKAVKAEGPTRVYKRLNLVMIYNINKNPAVSKKFRADRNWVKRTYMK